MSESRLCRETANGSNWRGVRREFGLDVVTAGKMETRTGGRGLRRALDHRFVRRSKALGHRIQGVQDFLLVED